VLVELLDCDVFVSIDGEVVFVAPGGAVELASVLFCAVVCLAVGSFDGNLVVLLVCSIVVLLDEIVEELGSDTTSRELEKLVTWLGEEAGASEADFCWVAFSDELSTK
jgi:hypothetical protein